MKAAAGALTDFACHTAVEPGEDNITVSEVFWLAGLDLQLAEGLRHG